MAHPAPAALSVESFLRKALAEVSARDIWSHAHVGLTEGYERQPLLKTGELEIVVVTWAPGGASPLHGHGDSTGVVRVVTGALWEERYLPDGDEFTYERRLLSTGETVLEPEGVIHRVTSVGASVTVHAYSPELIDPKEEVPENIVRKLREARRRSISV